MTRTGPCASAQGYDARPNFGIQVLDDNGSGPDRVPDGKICGSFDNAREDGIGPMRHGIGMKAAPRPPAVRHPVEPNTPNSEGAERIDPRWAWHHRTLLGLRARLLQAHAEHGTEVASPPEMLGLDVDEAPRDELDRDVLWTELGHEEDKLFEIDCALSRLRDGSYGFCELTGVPIPEERLRAIPWTRYSVNAAKWVESRSDMPGGV